MNRVVTCLLLSASWTLLSCRTSKSVSVSELKRIQDEEGFWSKSLYYCGSNRARHYFEQEHPFEALFAWPIGNDGVHRYKTRRDELDLGSIQSFDRQEYGGADDPRRRKIRIQAPDRKTGRAAVNPRKEAGERFKEKYGEFDPARVKLIPEGKNRYRVEYE